MGRGAEKSGPAKRRAQNKDLEAQDSQHNSGHRAKRKQDVQANVNKKAQKRADKAEAQREAQRQRDRLNSPQRLTKPQPSKLQRISSLESEVSDTIKAVQDSVQQGQEISAQQQIKKADAAEPTVDDSPAKDTRKSCQGELVPLQISDFSEELGTVAGLPVSTKPAQTYPAASIPDLERKSGRIRPDDFAVPVHPATPYVAARDNESSLLPLVPMLPLSLLDGSTAEADVEGDLQHQPDDHEALIISPAPDCLFQSHPLTADVEGDLQHQPDDHEAPIINPAPDRLFQSHPLTDLSPRHDTTAVTGEQAEDKQGLAVDDDVGNDAKTDDGNEQAEDGEGLVVQTEVTDQGSRTRGLARLGRRCAGFAWRHRHALTGLAGVSFVLAGSRALRGGRL